MRKCIFFAIVVLVLGLFLFWCPELEGYPESVRFWCPLIKISSWTYGVDCRLVAAVIQVESDGDFLATSSQGAVGLMQVMPSDVKMVCQYGDCFADRPPAWLLYLPWVNIDWGSRLLSEYVGYHGSIREGLKVYGPMGVGYFYADVVLSVKEGGKK